jgi:hypothetical protein
MAASDFFSRWAKPAAAPEARSPQPAPTPTDPGQPADPVSAAQSPVTPAQPPTLEQARQLTPQDDFRAFVQPDVAPEVRNTALRQLFSDPHFNVMDGLDIYIDDYNTPDPLPEGYLARMVSAQAMRLLKSETESERPDPNPAPAREHLATGPAQPEPEQHLDNPDLRLQPNPAPGPAGDGTGAD